MKQGVSSDFAFPWREQDVGFRAYRVYDVPSSWALLQSRRLLPVQAFESEFRFYSPRTTLLHTGQFLSFFRTNLSV